ncbi:type II toxin-antitoxin system mRNA interferase toxin, RelE/StbE family [Patescibacteria group bacterium]|nr:type II toxin-antitoxin system mRNA interferase toxin, RelE/StbE family [Patescibacteria group bacterium]MCL5010406.1 type II toxin-antitoxin system mRNA interferase toxin, RelE/StbE family [Patescibacteria group bacterium]
MFSLIATSGYDDAYKKLIKGNPEKEKRTKKAVKLIRTDPFYPSLKSHKVNTRNFGEKWSSFITGDLRIIWDFDEVEKKIILLFTIAKHSGSHREYK